MLGCIFVPVALESALLYYYHVNYNNNEESLYPLYQRSNCNS